jgi:hypothetical protein
VLLFFLGQSGPRSFYFRLPAVPGMTAACHHTQLFSIKMGSWCFFFAPAGLGKKTTNPPDLSLPHSLG